MSEQNQPTESTELTTTKQLTADQLERRKRVFEICEELFLSGDKTSVRNVLARMPSVKSTSTINAFVREWNTESKNKRIDKIKARGFSDEFVNLFSIEISRLSSAKDAEHKVEIEFYKDEADLANDLLIQTERDLEISKATVSEAEETISLKDKEIIQVRTEYAQREQHTADVIEKMSSDIDTLREQLQLMNKKYESSQESLAREQVTTSNHKELINKLESNLEESRCKVTTLNDQVTDLTGQKIRFETKAQGDEVLIGELRTSRDNAVSDLSTKEAEYLEVKTENARLTSELESATNRFGHSSERLTAVNDQLTELRITNNQNVSTIERQAAFNSRLEGDIERLTQTNEKANDAKSKLEKQLETQKEFNTKLSAEKNELKDKNADLCKINTELRQQLKGKGKLVPEDTSQPEVDNDSDFIKNNE